jgi:hypothetical protein
VALFGRKINQAENQLAFVQFLRLITDGVLEPVEAVRAYHSVLAKLGLTPHRPLEKDLELQTGVMSYGGSGTTISVPEAGAGKKAAGADRKTSAVTPPTPPSKGGVNAGRPDFARMSPAERLAYHKARLDGMFGR